MFVALTVWKCGSTCSGPDNYKMWAHLSKIRDLLFSAYEMGIGHRVTQTLECVLVALTNESSTYLRDGILNFSQGDKE